MELMPNNMGYSMMEQVLGSKDWYLLKIKNYVVSSEKFCVGDGT
jgi:hypothetical protein